MSRTPSPAPRYRILASTPAGEDLECFTWTREPEAGIARAQRDAIAFGRADLTNFRADPIA